MKKTILITAAALLSLTACKNSKFPGYEEISGSYFKLDKKGDESKTINKGDVVFMSHTMTNEKDSLLFSYKTMLRPGQPYAMRLDLPKYKGDMFEMMLKMHEKDSASFMLRIDSMFHKYYHQPIPKFLDSTGYIIYHVRIDSVYSSTKVDEIEKKNKAAQEAFLNKAKNAEDSLMKKYLADNKITEKPTASGLYIVTKEKGKGAKIKEGDNTEVKYKGMLTNGQVFDESAKHDKPFSFNVGQKQVIPAWDEALLTMSVGSKALIVCPSAIAYGPNGSGPIPPYSPLVFEIEVVKINPVNSAAAQK
jgi:FKBP-type peptidyl-prolyl cis-trans isomerase FkpA